MMELNRLLIKLLQSLRVKPVWLNMSASGIKIIRLKLLISFEVTIMFDDSENAIS